MANAEIMSRTAINVAGDLVASQVMNRWIEAGDAEGASG